jgi:hypothetical protein
MERNMNIQVHCRQEQHALAQDADLVRRFGVSMSQLSGDIDRYLALDPAYVSYDKSAKRPASIARARSAPSPASGRG